MTQTKSLFKFIQADAFTRSPFRGRPVAVCILPQPLEDEALGRLAGELGAAETAFVRDVSDGGPPRYDLSVIARAGDDDGGVTAALAAAHVLWTEGAAGHMQRLELTTRAGRHVAAKRADHVAVDTAARLARPLAGTSAHPTLLRGPHVRFVGGDGLALLIELENEAHVREFVPETAHLEQGPWRHLIVTAKSDNRLRDFVSRVFTPSTQEGAAPQEALVTGSAHALLGPYWLQKLDAGTLSGEQLGARPGVVHVERAPEPGRVIVAGQAVTTLKGLVMVAP